MNQKPGPSAPHPDELLVAYVDGSASAEAIQSVESHLDACSQCREDVQFARAGRAALRDLPELEAPGIARESLSDVLDEGDRTGGRPPIVLDERRGRGRGRVWEQAAWAAAVAAVAAGIIGAVIFISMGGTNRTSVGAAKAPVEATLPQTTAAPSVVNRGIDYSPDSLTALAKTLALSSRSPLAVPAPSNSLTDLRGSTSVAAADQLDPTTITSCLRAGSGLGADAVPTYLEVATYRATPAYVGAFPSDAGSPHLLLIVVSADGCQPLFVVSQSQ